MRLLENLTIYNDYEYRGGNYGKVIMLSDDVYEQLNRMKGLRESFSDVIRRLLKYRPKLTEVAESKTITVEDWEMVKEAFKVQKKMDEERKRDLLRSVCK
ncbi:antitoxin VapB family protein [Candidatus Bathyarchaeota archaeon]|nr:antitoxin VapB family protein [Candidatus Bathyarchaeota archaeon]